MFTGGERGSHHVKLDQFMTMFSMTRPPLSLDFFIHNSSRNKCLKQWQAACMDLLFRGSHSRTSCWTDTIRIRAISLRYLCNPRLTSKYNVSSDNDRNLMCSVPMNPPALDVPSFMAEHTEAGLGIMIHAMRHAPCAT